MEERDNARRNRAAGTQQEDDMTITQLAQAIETQGTDMAKIGPKEAALAAARADDLTIPAALDRTKGMSKEDFDKLHDKLSKPAPKSKAKLKVIPPAKPATLTEADKKAIRELKAAEKLATAEKAKEKAAAAKEARAEQKAIRDAAKAAKKANGPAKPQGSPPVASTPKTATKTTPKAKPASEARKGSKTALIGDLLKRKEGCTTADVLKATGWPAVSMPQQAKAVGVKLRKEKKPGEVTRYWAA